MTTVKSFLKKFLGLCDKNRDLALLLIRLTLGIIFFQTGSGKLLQFNRTVSFFTSLGIPFPKFNALLSSSTEFGGSILLILGLGTRLIAIPLAMVMLVAILTALLPELTGFSDLIRLQEWDYLLTFILFATIGSGKFSLDYLIAKKFKD